MADIDAVALEWAAHVMTGHLCGQCKCSSESGWADEKRDCGCRQAARDTITTYLAALASAKPAQAGECASASLPEMPDEDHDFTPELGRKIIGLYQSAIRTLAHRTQSAEHALGHEIKIKCDAINSFRAASTRAEAAEARALAADRRLATCTEALGTLVARLDSCRTVERGAGGMSIDAQVARTVLIDVRLIWVEEARAALSEASHER
jgi:hypothetical protein